MCKYETMKDIGFGDKVAYCKKKKQNIGRPIINNKPGKAILGKHICEDCKFKEEL